MKTVDDMTDEEITQMFENWAPSDKAVSWERIEDAPAAEHLSWAQAHMAGLRRESEKTLYEALKHACQEGLDWNSIYYELSPKPGEATPEKVAALREWYSQQS